MIANVRMLCASGERKAVAVTPLVIQLNQGHMHNILIHVFYERRDHGQEWFRKLAMGIENLFESLDPDSEEISMLTSREQEVLRLVALGFKTEHIASNLTISKHTVFNHIRNARIKLHASKKLDAVLIALHNGLL